MRLVQALRRWKAPVVSDPVIGSALGGGFYVGRILVEGVSWFLIVAPKASGEANGQYWNTNGSVATTINSAWDGAANMAAIYATANPISFRAAVFCKGLSIAGYTDWALPAKDQLELVYRNLKPSTQGNSTNSGANLNSYPAGSNYTSSGPAQTDIDAFRLGGAEALSTNNYWTSTRFSSSAAWRQSFADGAQSGASVDGSTLSVRAVRMIPA